MAVGERTLLESGITKHGEIIVMTAGRLSGLGLSSSIKIHRVGEEIAYTKSAMIEDEVVR